MINKHVVLKIATFMFVLCWCDVRRLFDAEMLHNTRVVCNVGQRRRLRELTADCACDRVSPRWDGVG